VLLHVELEEFFKLRVGVINKIALRKGEQRHSAY